MFLASAHPSHLEKEDRKNQKKPCVLLPRTGRAVRCVLERGEDMLITGARHPVQGKYKVPHRVLFWFEFPMKGIKGLLLVLVFQVGFMNDGRILGADFQFYTNAGNTVDESLWVCKSALPHCLRVFRWCVADVFSPSRLQKRWCFFSTIPTTSPTCGAVLLPAEPTCPPTRPSGALVCPKDYWWWRTC